MINAASKVKDVRRGSLRRVLSVCAAAGVLSGAVVAVPANAQNAPRSTREVEPRLAASALTFTVNSTNDTPDADPGNGICADSLGHCTLAAAAGEANALERPVVVKLAAHDYSTSSLGSLTLNDVAGIDIVGVGAKSVIDGGGSGDSTVVVNGTAVFEDLSITGGTATDGGGIDVNQKTAAVTVKSVTIDGNSASQGGGVYNDGSLWMSGSTITNNDSGSEGAGINNRGELLVLTDSSITHNLVTNASGDARGGGLYSDGPTIVNHDTFSNDLATSNGSSGLGGGAYFDESAIVTNSTFSDNYAGAALFASSASAYGGGIYNCYGLGSLTNDTISNNIADALGSDPAYGAGLDSECGGLTISGSTFSGNHTISSNTGSAYGGAIALGDDNGPGFANIETTTIKNNIAEATGTAGIGDGGGVAVSGGSGSNGGATNITNSTIEGNQAISTSGEASFNQGGGGVFDGSCGEGSTISGTLFENNAAVDAQGGGFYDGSCGDSLSYDRFISNRATGTVGTSPEQAQGAGGGLSLYDVATVTHTLVSGNRASQFGGGIYSDDAQTIVDSTIVGNQAPEGGGYFSDGTALITSSAIVNNIATGILGSGGGLYFKGGSAGLDGSTVAGNEAQYGAGLFSIIPAGSFRDSLVAGNKKPSGAEDDCLFEGNGYLGSGGGNRLGDATCNLRVTGDRQGKSDDGYVIATASGKIAGYHTGTYGSPSGHLGAFGSVVGAAAAADGQGYWLVTSKGHVFAYGSAQSFGNAAGKDIVGIAASPDGLGYWLVAKDGHVYGFGSAATFGNASTTTVGIAGTPDGAGYWLVSSTGQVTNYGSAIKLGSKVGQPIVGIAAAPDGLGYWLVSHTGKVFGFGTAKVHGSKSAPVVGIAAAPDGGGYWLLGSTGAIYNFGTAPSYGSLVTQHHPAAVSSFFGL